MGLGWSSASLCLTGAITAQTSQEEHWGQCLEQRVRPGNADFPDTSSFGHQELWLLLRAGWDLAHLGRAGSSNFAVFPTQPSADSCSSAQGGVGSCLLGIGGAGCPACGWGAHMPQPHHTALGAAAAGVRGLWAVCTPLMSACLGAQSWDSVIWVNDSNVPPFSPCRSSRPRITSPPKSSYFPR